MRRPVEDLPPSDQRADKGARKAGLWAIIIGALVLGITLAALEFGGRADEDRYNQPARGSDMPTPAAPAAP